MNDIYIYCSGIVLSHLLEIKVLVFLFCEGTLNGENVAIKEILSGGKTTSQDLKREADIMSNVDHNNIVQFIEVWTDLRYFVIVMEFMENGDLLGFLKNYKTTENVKKGIATDVSIIYNPSIREMRKNICPV